MSLTPRQLEILRLRCTGKSYAAIAEAAFISPATVRRHLKSAYQAIGVHGGVAACRWLFERERKTEANS